MDKKKILYVFNYLPAVFIFVAELVGVKAVGINMALIIIISILNILMCNREEQGKNAWAMIISVAFAQGIAFAIRYYLIGSDYEDPVVGLFFIVIQAGLALALMLIGMLILRARDYMNNKDQERMM
ncbi:MAG: hypothetical protein K5769_02105 [Pseudobutyrivibrio sp.]|nr:hypothetical protein [Pseudobutyrivibrio sp.]